MEWLYLLLILVVILGYQFLRNRSQYICPDCKTLFKHNLISMRLVEEPSLLKGGKSVTKYKCRKCDHMWVYERNEAARIWGLFDIFHHFP